MKICFLAPGGNVHTTRWVEALAGRGHEVLLIAAGAPASLSVEVFDPSGALGRWARVPKARALVMERLMLERIAAFGPDVVHIHWLEAALSTLRLVRRLDRVAVSVWGRDVVWDHAGPEPYMRLFWKRRILRRAGAVTATSDFLARRTVPLVPSGREVEVIPFGVDCARFRPDPRPRAHGAPVIGFLKHYLPKYGPDVLLRAAAELARRGVDFRLVMHDTKDPEPYRRLAVELGLSGRAAIGGVLEHSRAVETLASFDVFAMPSIYDSETFGVAALEAAACEVPVVASGVGGVPEVVDDGSTGYLVPPSDPVALAGRLEVLLRDAELRRRFGAAGRRLVLRRYRWDACVDRMEELYGRLSKSPRRARSMTSRSGSPRMK